MALRDSRLQGYKFRRQAVIGRRIVDFFCPAKSLVVEIDGDTHDPDRDETRDGTLEARLGYRTLRFTNAQVMRELDGVLQVLISALEKAPDRWSRATSTCSTEAPSSSEEGVGGGGEKKPIVGQAVRLAAGRLESVSDTARLDAELLMAHALGCSRSELLLRHMADPEPEGFPALVERRLAHEPVAYITGVQHFFGLDFAVAPGVLIPRADSETIVEAALAACPSPARVLDCGVGPGTLLLSVLSERPGARGLGVDRSEQALALARRNAAALGLAQRVELLARDWTEGDWAQGLGTFDLVLANPPYVEDAAELDRQVREWEPAGALFAGPDGLDDYRILVPQLPGLLAPGGTAVLEIGATQSAEVAALAGAAGLAVREYRDLGGRPRALALRICPWQTAGE